MEQTEIKKTLSIDLSQATSSLSEFKAKIEELKNSLAQLDATTQEYRDTLEALKEAQEELNQMMQMDDSIKESYNEITQAAQRTTEAIESLKDAGDNLNKSIDNSMIGDDAFSGMVDSANEATNALNDLNDTTGELGESLDIGDSTTVAFEGIVDAANDANDALNYIKDTADSLGESLDIGDSTTGAFEGIVDAANDASDALDGLKGTTEELNDQSEQTFSSMKEYKQYIDSLKASLIDLDSSSQQYKDVANEIQAAQQKLNEIMMVAKGNNDAVEGSYNQLTQTMAQLKKEWKATGDEQERSEIGAKILDINNQLKTLDASTGNFQRNVGDYQNAFTNAMGSLQSGITSSIPAVGKLSTALKALAMNPVGAVITAIAIAVGVMTNAISGSEEQSNRLREALAPLQPVMNAIKNAISWVSEALIKFAEIIGKQVANRIEALAKGLGLIKNGLENLKTLFEKFGWDGFADKAGKAADKVGEAQDKVGKSVQKNIDLTQRENKLLETKRKVNEQVAENEATMSELRAKIYDKEKYSYEERMKFNEDYSKLSKENLEMQKGLVQEELAIIQERNGQTKSGTQDYEAESAAKVKLFNINKKFNEEEATSNRRRTTLMNEAKSAAKAAADAAKKLNDEVREILEEIDKFSMTEIEKELYELEKEYKEHFATLRKSGQDTTELTRKYAQEQIKILSDYTKDIESQINGYYRTEEQNRIDALEKTYSEQYKKLEEAKQAEIQILEQSGKDTTTTIEKYDKLQLELKKQTEDAKAKIVLDTTARTANKEKEIREQALEAAAKQDVFDIENDPEITNEQEKAQRIYEIERQLIEDKIALQEEYLLTFKGTDEELAAAELELDNLKQELANKDKQRSKEVADENIKNAKAELEERRAAYSTIASSAASIFGTLSDLSDDNSKEQKAYAKMEAVINGLVAIVNTFKGYAGFGPWGWAAAVAQAATIAATTAATIKKIDATNKGSVGSSITTPSAATPSMTQVTPLLDQESDVNRLTSLNVNGDTQETKQQDIRVYVVDQDIRDANYRAEVVEDNATF